jgi:hypothetical protein
MAVIVECSCGEQLRVNDDLLGKKVQCPGCQGAVMVPASAPPADRAEEVRPRRERSGEGPGPQAKQSGSGLWLLLGLASGALLLCCGGGSVGVGSLFMYVKSLEPPEQTILGTWQLDRAASSYNPLVQNMQDDITLEFRQDKTYRMALGGPVEKGTYAITGKTGKVLKLTFTPEGPFSQSSDLILEVRDKNRLYVDHRKLSGFEVTRVQAPD